MLKVNWFCMWVCERLWANSLSFADSNRRNHIIDKNKENDETAIDLRPNRLINDFSERPYTRYLSLHNHLAHSLSLSLSLFLSFQLNVRHCIAQEQCMRMSLHRFQNGARILAATFDKIHSIWINLRLRIQILIDILYGIVWILWFRLDIWWNLCNLIRFF